MDRERELSRFIPHWIDKPKPQVVEELASYSLETKRIPDPYYFLIRDDGKLISPQTGKLVEDSVEKKSYLGQMEFRALQSIQEWSVGKSKGIAFWFSPPNTERSKFTKLIVSEIENYETERRLFNRNLLLEIDAQETMLLVQELTSKGANPVVFKTPEELRSQPVFSDNSDLNWLDFFDMRVNDKTIWEQIRSGEDILAKELAIKNSGSIYETIFGQDYPKGYDDEKVKRAVEKAREMNVFGSLPGSCPPPLLLTQEENTALGVFFKNSERSFPCPECHKPIPSGEGITKCPHCGITKEEYGSRCD